VINFMTFIRLVDMLEGSKAPSGSGPLFHLRLNLDTNEVICDPPLANLAQQIISLFETISTALSNVARIESISNWTLCVTNVNR